MELPFAPCTPHHGGLTFMKVATRPGRFTPGGEWLRGRGVGRKQGTPGSQVRSPQGDCHTLYSHCDICRVWTKASLWLCQVKYNPRAISYMFVPHNWVFWMFSNICLWRVSLYLHALRSILPPIFKPLLLHTVFQDLNCFFHLKTISHYFEFWIIHIFCFLITSCWVIEGWLPRAVYVSYYLWRFSALTEDTFLRSVKRGSLIWQIFAERWLCPGCSRGSEEAACSKWVKTQRRITIVLMEQAQRRHNTLKRQWGTESDFLRWQGVELAILQLFEFIAYIMLDYHLNFYSFFFPYWGSIMFSEFRTYKFSYLVKVVSLALLEIMLILIAKQLTGCSCSHTCHSF